MSEFRPAPFLAGGHRQTLLGYWWRRRLRWRLPAEDLVVEADGGIRLLLRASWQAEHAVRPTLVLVHGLGGCDRSTYSVATGTLAWRLGWNVVRMNMRGAGESEALCPRLYHAGVDTDLLAVLDAMATRTPSLAVAGFSLGANVALLALGRQASRIPRGVFAAAAVSPPVDLAACADALGRGGNRVYERHYVRDLKRAYRRRQSRLPDVYETGLEQGVRTIREYDDAITARYGGFRDAADYYERSSAGPHLLGIDRPTLLLGTADDPMIPVDSVIRWPLPPSGLVQREILSTGGHVGFVAPTSAPGRFWAAERVMEFLEPLRPTTPAHAALAAHESSVDP
ncbi:MAG: alpha/beta hydrolase [Acidobacteria bacterium]|nr:MAG: alpha/beta hydrolase [Acidobacteriota bacterium]